MNNWFDECSVVAYPHEIRFLNIDGGSMSYCVDRHVSEYVGKIQAQLNTLQNENRDKDIKNMNLQSKIDKAIEYIENNLLPSHNIEKTDWEFEEVIYSDLPVERIKPLIDILKEAENVENN